MPESPTKIIMTDISEEKFFFRYSLVIEYDGEAFCGSQRQANANTVQTELEKAISIILQSDTKVIFSGRTDKGVHAKNQVIHFNTQFRIDTYKFLYSLNAILSKNISVKSIKEADKSFHSQKSAKYRWYRYTINNKTQRSVWLDKISCHIHEKLNINDMQKALNFLVGRHDFTAFKCANTLNPAKECTILYAACRNKSGVIYIDLIADRFLYNMVRIITGTLIKIGLNVFPPEQMQIALESKDRRNAGPTAEPKGLALMMVGYEEKHDIKLNTEIKIDENVLCKAS